jgi:hypothetical protein
MLTNKYSKLYFSITDRAKNRSLTCYTEKHHILPESLGGSNDKENLVDLTAREHFICHWLLIKMTEGEDRSKMLYALNGMKAENRYQQRYSSAITSRVYERYRVEHAKNHSETMKGKTPVNKGKKMSGEQKALLRERAKANHASGKVYSDESQKKRLAKLVGYKHSEETKQKQRQSQLGKIKGPQSEEHRKAISDSMKGKTKKQGHADNVRKANLGVVSINKNGIEKKVKKDTLDQWLSQGWQLGGKPRIKSKQS